MYHIKTNMIWRVKEGEVLNSLKTTTNHKLDYYLKQKADLQECLTNGNLTKDGIHFVKDEIEKADKNIDYYQEILKVLEEK